MMRRMAEDTDTPSSSLLAEIPEAEATGDIARIYGEMRRFCGVPYVSTLQRHVATMPGCLEWVWAALRPGFVSGEIPETAWRLAGDRADRWKVSPLPPLSAEALRLLGVDDAILPPTSLQRMGRVPTT